MTILIMATTIMIMISTAIFQNITEKLETVTDFVFTILGGFIGTQGVTCDPWVRKGFIKLQ